MTERTRRVGTIAHVHGGARLAAILSPAIMAAIARSAEQGQVIERSHETPQASPVPPEPQVSRQVRRAAVRRGR